MFKKYSHFERNYTLFVKVVKDDSLFKDKVERKAKTITNTNCIVTNFYKYRDFRSMDLKNNKVRIIYFLYDSELHLIEIYIKNSSENNNMNLIKTYCKYYLENFT